MKGLGMSEENTVEERSARRGWNARRILRTALPLFLISLAIGYVLDVSNLSPLQVWAGVGDWFANSWMSIFGSLPDIGAVILRIGQWVLMGALIGVPIWAVFVLSGKMLGR